MYKHYIKQLKLQKLHLIHTVLVKKILYTNIYIHLQCIIFIFTKLLTYSDLILPSTFSIKIKSHLLECLQYNIRQKLLNLSNSRNSLHRYIKYGMLRIQIKLKDLF